MSKRALESFAFGNKDGTIASVNSDEVYADDHPFVKAYPKMFRDLEDDSTIIKAKRDRPVEQATAAPGEKRATRKP